MLVAFTEIPAYAHVILTYTLPYYDKSLGELVIGGFELTYASYLVRYLGR
jgi:hypothetical protein